MITLGGYTMRQFTVLSIVAFLTLSACAPSTPSTPSPHAIQTAIAQTQAAAEKPDQFSNRLNRLLEEGATLNAMTIQGVTFPEFRLQLAHAKGAYSLALSAQSGSRSIPPEGITELNLAFTGWDLARSVWDAKLNGGGAPHAPDAVRYAELVEYVGLDKLPFVGGVPGEGDVDQDQVIRILWGMATDHFTGVQALLLDEMR
jgi:hypothetical protein